MVRDPATWAEVWTAIWRWHSPAPSLPEVDFTREMVVVGVPGRGVTHVANFLVDSAVRSRDGVTVQLLTITPGGASVSYGSPRVGWCSLSSCCDRRR